MIGPIVYAAIAYMVIGGIWYSPFIFGRMWLRLSHLQQGDLVHHWLALGLSFLTACITSAILAFVIIQLQFTSMAQGMLIGVVAWLGFIAPAQLLEVLYSGKKTKLFLLDTGCQLVSMAVMGALLGFFF